MKTITIVTGSAHKLREWQRIFPDTYTLESVKLDLDEIQSLDPVAIAVDKVKRAFAALGKPVIVDDISAGLDVLEGLPGPFVKFFEEKLGNDALYQLAGKESSCTITAIAAYYDGKNSVVGRGDIRGKVVPLTEGEGAFGFDFVFVPDGHNQTFAQMGPAEKDKISHRALAVQDLIRQLNDL